MTILKSTVAISSVEWIRSLSEEECSSADSVADDLELYLKNKNISFYLHDIKTSKGLSEALNQILARAKCGDRPIIHFDSHGKENDGIQIAATGQLVPWDEIDIALGRINVETKNNLCVVSFACYSFDLIRPISITEPTPFYLLLAPEKKLTNGDIADHTMPFYRHIFEDKDILEAYKENFETWMRMMHSEQLLFMSLAGYIRAFCMGKGREQRIEDLITAANTNGKLSNRHGLRAARRIARGATKPTALDFNKYVNRFLMGRPVSYTRDDVIRYAKDMEDPYESGVRSRPRVLDNL